MQEESSGYSDRPRQQIECDNDASRSCLDCKTTFVEPVEVCHVCNVAVHEKKPAQDNEAESSSSSKEKTTQPGSNFKVAREDVSYSHDALAEKEADKDDIDSHDALAEKEEDGVVTDSHDAMTCMTEKVAGNDIIDSNDAFVELHGNLLDNNTNTGDCSLTEKPSAADAEQNVKKPDEHDDSVGSECKPETINQKMAKRSAETAILDNPMDKSIIGSKKPRECPQAQDAGVAPDTGGVNGASADVTTGSRIEDGQGVNPATNTLLHIAQGYTTGNPLLTR